MSALVPGERQKYMVSNGFRPSFIKTCSEPMGILMFLRIQGLGTMGTNKILGVCSILLVMDVRLSGVLFD